jgi:crossover junction endodeoxyribonuclease RuvC
MIRNQPPDILALDLATRTGWARGVANGEPEFGSVNFGKQGASNPARFAHALDFAIDIFKCDSPPDILVIEAPIKVQAFSVQQAAKMLFGLPAIFMGVAYKCEVRRIYERDVRDVRNVFIGHRNLKTAHAKEAVERRCRQLGWHAPDHNAADALALWAYESTRVDPRPMFDRLGKVGICV